MTVAITEEDANKTVVDSDGTRLGTVSEVAHGRAHVSADPDVVDRMKRRLPAGSVDEETYGLDDESVAEITDEEIVLAKDI